MEKKKEEKKDKPQHLSHKCVSDFPDPHIVGTSYPDQSLAVNCAANLICLDVTLSLQEFYSKHSAPRPFTFTEDKNQIKDDPLITITDITDGEKKKKRTELVSQLVGALSPVNHRGLHQG